MGQYYIALNIEDNQFVRSHGFAKITEHSWIGNEFVGAVMKLMSPGGKWYKKPVVWVGDYYGDEEGEIDYYKQRDNFVEVFKEDVFSSFMTKKEQRKSILVNHTKKEYVRFFKVPSFDGWIVNPLPILTALGNNRGGGDYFEKYPDFDKVGIWAKDILSVETKIPKGYKELVVNFKVD